MNQRAATVRRLPRWTDLWHCRIRLVGRQITREGPSWPIFSGEGRSGASEADASRSPHQRPSRIVFPGVLASHLRILQPVVVHHSAESDRVAPERHGRHGRPKDVVREVNQNPAKQKRNWRKSAIHAALKTISWTTQARIRPLYPRAPVLNNAREVHRQRARVANEQEHGAVQAEGRHGIRQEDEDACRQSNDRYRNFKNSADGSERESVVEVVVRDDISSEGRAGEAPLVSSQASSPKRSLGAIVLRRSGSSNSILERERHRTALHGVSAQHRDGGGVAEARRGTGG